MCIGGGLLRNHKNRSKSSKQAASEDTEYRDRVGRRSKRQDQTSAMISSVTACVTRTAKAKIHHTHQKLRLRRERAEIEGLGLDNTPFTSETMDGCIAHGQSNRSPAWASTSQLKTFFVAPAWAFAKPDRSKLSGSLNMHAEGAQSQPYALAQKEG